MFFSLFKILLMLSFFWIPFLIAKVLKLTVDFETWYSIPFMLTTFIFCIIGLFLIIEEISKIKVK